MLEMLTVNPYPAVAGLHDGQFGGEDIDPQTGTLWFAGKLMQPNMMLSDYVGRNDRSKVVVKLQKKGAGAPAREPVSGPRYTDVCNHDWDQFLGCLA